MTGPILRARCGQRLSGWYELERETELWRKLYPCRGKTPLSKSIVAVFAMVGKTQRTNARSTKVSLLFRKARETGHYAAEHLWNEELGRWSQDVERQTSTFYELTNLNVQAEVRGLSTRSSAGTATLHWCRRSRTSSTWRIRVAPGAPRWEPDPCPQYPDRDFRG